MNEKQFLTKLYRKVPKNLSEEWDFPGYQCGNKDYLKQIKKIFLCLDFSEFTLEDCIKFNPDLILTHHPFFFGNKNEILQIDEKKKLLLNEINKLNAPIYSFHTNLDKINSGINDTFISLIKGKKIKVLDDGLMRIFTFDKKMNINEIVDLLSKTFNFDSSQIFFTNKFDDCERFALIAGGASSDWKFAYNEKVDCYISGDCPHHTRLDMRRYNFNYIEIPHECEEECFNICMEKFINDIDPTIEVKKYYYEKYFLNIKTC